MCLMNTTVNAPTNNANGIPSTNNANGIPSKNRMRWTREKYGPVGSNTDSGSKIRVYYSDTTNLYLAFIIRNLSKSIKINIIKIVIVEFSKSKRIILLK
jgi:hypothetical protein